MKKIFCLFITLGITISFVLGCVKKEEVTKKYYSSGELLEEIIYKKGTRDGVSKEYFESGALKAKMPIRNDQLNGMTMVYYESGSPRAAVPFQNNKAEGVASLYYENGTLHFENTYKEGILIHREEYDESGNLISEK